MPDVRFGVLGPITAWRGAAPVEVGSAKCLRVLGVLLLHANRRVDREQIIEGAWGGKPPRSAVNLVQKYVGDVRRSLELDDGSLQTVGTGYLLRVAPGRLDSDRFAAGLDRARETRGDGDLAAARQHLAEAMTLWRGPAFSGIDTPAAATERARLDEYRLGALEDLAELDLLRGEHAPAIPELSRVTGEHPYRERARELLMLALYRSGRQGDALAVFDDIRRLLAEELGANPGPGLQRVHARILRADPALDLVTHERPRPIAQLPADIPDFTGRAGPLGELLDLLAGRRVVVVAGAPGTGKSALAVRALHDARDEFPDGQLYLDLAGTSAVPRDPAVLLAELLRALGVTDAVMPPGLHERAALYRSRLAGRRMLVLLDDAAGAQQVRPLLPPSGGCAVVVTSRHRLADLAGAEHVELDVLSTEDALALFARIAGAERVEREPEQAEEIVRLCGRLPLAIRITGAKLASRRAWTLQVLRDRLADESRQLRELRVGDLDVRANFDLSLRLLPEDAVRAFRLLGLLGAETLPAWVIGPLLGRHVPDDVLDALVDAYLVRLVTTDRAGQPRYRLHDLLRAYASEGAQEHYSLEDRRAAVERVLAAWLALAEQARDLCYPSLFRPAPGRSPRWAPDHTVVDPITWFDAERGTLLRAIELAAAWGLDEAAWELAVAAVPYYDHRSLYQDWNRSHRIALDATVAAGNTHGEAALLQGLGQVHIYLDEMTEARNDLHRCVKLYQSIGDRRGEGLALASLGTVHRVRGELDAALAVDKEALEHVVAAGHGQAEAQLRTAIGIIGFEQGAGDAGPWIEEGLRIARRLGDRHRQAVILRTLSRYHLETGDTPAALRSLTEALTIFSEISDERCGAHTDQRLGAIHAELGDRVRAESALQRAAHVFRANGDRSNEAACWQQLGELERDLGDPAAARRHLGLAVELWRAVGLPERAEEVAATLPGTAG
ncbi:MULTISPECIES: BTAD domain-containing putative transcriptional regulator [unclassified Amycolatopsis]|uniref:AfsR/SARP family transcriptional regulator n=1 Tax=unclassified Amycolatopsis TaxID=2618356 RepID=UPI002876F43C|nr:MULTISPECIES: BTAD domain-containing putative transcriptional regulator [unclassified Amycolatopsis]MDS0132227.1 winged helix-turn-helix domain-containing protein [Amycolatopsis sp. 505]MDS0141035.1 winged helix-turn-helix domain-containing protein [Amycolatopsis sp. CM201R]